MTNYFEATLFAEDYCEAGSIQFEKPPLINTSTDELAALGYHLWVESRYVQSHGHSRVRMRFYHHDSGSQSLNFNVWIPMKIQSTEAVINLLRSGTLVPNGLTKNAATIKVSAVDPGSFQSVADTRDLIPVADSSLEVRKKIDILDPAFELVFLRLINDKRAEALKVQKKEETFPAVPGSEPTSEDLAEWLSALFAPEKKVLADAK